MLKASTVDSVLSVLALFQDCVGEHGYRLNCSLWLERDQILFQVAYQVQICSEDDRALFDKR